MCPYGRQENMGKMMCATYNSALKALPHMSYIDCSLLRWLEDHSYGKLGHHVLKYSRHNVE